MPQTHDVGNRFVHFQPHPRGATVVTVAETYEIEEPFRVARSVAIRLWPFRWTVVFGHWDPDTATWDIEDPVIDQRLQAALSAHGAKPEEQGARTQATQDLPSGLASRPS